MDMGTYSLADVAAATRGGYDGYGCGGGGWWWIILLFLFAGGNGGWGNNGRQATTGDVERGFYQQDVMGGLRNIQNSVSNGLCDGFYAMNNAIHGAQDSTLVSRYELGSQIADCCCTTNRNIDQSRYDMSLAACGIKENDDANTQKILDALHQNEVDSLRGRINQLELQSALCGVVRYPNATTYTAGFNPYFNGQGCGCGMAA